MTYPAAPFATPAYATPSAPGHGRLVVHASFPKVWLELFFTGPTVVVDGHPVRAQWGVTTLDVLAGQHLVEVNTRYLWTIGRAHARIPVGPGQQVPVYYRAPAMAFLRGSIGPRPQSTNGYVPALLAAALFGVLVAMVVFWLQ